SLLASRASHFLDLAPTGLETLSLHDALPISRRAIDSAPVYEPPFLESGYLDPARPEARGYRISLRRGQRLNVEFSLRGVDAAPLDRKSTRLNSSHVKISYAVFCLKKKNQI